MRRWNLVLVALALTAVAHLASAAVAPDGPGEDAVDRRFAGQTLHLLNWPDYLDPDLVAGFERHYGVRVTTTDFDTDEHRDRLLAVQGIQGYDLGVLDSSRLDAYRRRGWIAPFDRALLTELPPIVERCTRTARGGLDDSLPYFWGTLGIVYRADRVTTPITHWLQLYRPDPALHGKILMIDDAVEVLGMALRALSRRMGGADLGSWSAAAKLARAQRPSVHAYGSLALSTQSALLSGDVLAAQVYNGDAQTLQALHPEVRYVHPAEGSSLWVDHWVLFAKAPQPALAHAFLVYINQPERAARNAQFVSFATCNASAEPRLPRAFRDNPVIYPPPQVLEHLEPYPSLSPEVVRQINTDFAQIKAQP